MLNKKELEKQGYSFIKVEGVEFLDMSNPVEKKVIRCPIVEAEQAMRNHFLETSQKRGKAFGIILPLVDQEDMTELLSELYDLRADTAMRKAEDNIAEEEEEEILETVNHFLGDVLSKIKIEKCRPKKTQPKNLQKKKVQKKA